MSTKTQNNLDIWAINDDITGHNAQVLGVCEAMQRPFIKKKIIFNEFSHDLLKFTINPLSCIDIKSSDTLLNKAPDVIVSCGRRTSAVSLALKKFYKKQGKQVFTVNIMWSGLSCLKHDMVALPQHDEVKLRFLFPNKFINIIGAPNRINNQLLEREYLIWHSTLGLFKKPTIGILIGGSTKDGGFQLSHAKKLIKIISELSSEKNVSILVSTSRRADVKLCEYLENSLKEKIAKNIYFHDYNKTKANPYYAMLECSDYLIVTGDSISMCSEACSTGKPVFIFSPKNMVSDKHKKFQDSLISESYAYECNLHNLQEYIIAEQKLEMKKLNSASIIAKKILEHINYTGLPH